MLKGIFPSQGRLSQGFQSTYAFLHKSLPHHLDLLYLDDFLLLARTHQFDFGVFFVDTWQKSINSDNSQLPRVFFMLIIKTFLLDGGALVSTASPRYLQGFLALAYAFSRNLVIGNLYVP